MLFREEKIASAIFSLVRGTCRILCPGWIQCQTRKWLFFLNRNMGTEQRKGRGSNFIVLTSFQRVIFSSFHCIKIIIHSVWANGYIAFRDLVSYISAWILSLDVEYCASVCCIPSNKTFRTSTVVWAVLLQPGMDLVGRLFAVADDTNSSPYGESASYSLPYSGPSHELDFKSDKSNKSSKSVVTYSTRGHPPGTSNIGDLTISI